MSDVNVKSAKHTPGPWRLQILGQQEADLIRHGTFMGLSGGSGAPDVLEEDDANEWEANAHLIAAAPEMYEALVKLSNEVMGSLPLMEALARREFGNTNYNILIQRAEEARAIIAKAEAR